jgi:hypothetical protein
MYKTVAACILVVAGCAARGLPIDNGGGGGGSGGAGGGGGSGAVADMTPPRDLGGSGAKCMTACDCQPGLACLQGICTKSALGPLYCCDGMCPPNGFCQKSSGGFGFCPGTSFDFGFSFPDGGGGSLCSQIPCSDNQVCQAFSCGFCNGKTCQLE